MKNGFCMLVILLLGAACQRDSTDRNVTQDSASTKTIALSEAQWSALNLKMGVVSVREVRSNLRVNGTLAIPPQYDVTISAPMDGFVKSTRLLEGMEVEKGSLIAVLEHSDYVQLQQDYLDSRSRLEFLKTEYERQSVLARENVNSQKAYQQAKSAYESLKAQGEGLAARLRMLKIDPEVLMRNGITSEIRMYSPLSGFVTMLNINTGKLTRSTDPMLSIADLRHLYVRVQVFEKDIHLVRRGQKVTFQRVGEDSLRTGGIFLVGKAINADGTIHVHVRPDKQDEGLLPGMFVTATIETSAQRQEVVPATAVLNVDGRKGVFVKRGDRQFEFTEIEAGPSVDGFITINRGAGMQRRDSVVIEGSFGLMGMLKNLSEE